MSENLQTESAIDREVDVECVSGRDVAGAEHSSKYKLSIRVKLGFAEEVPSKSDRSDPCSVDRLRLGQHDRRKPIERVLERTAKSTAPERIRQHQTIAESGG